ncbi:transmembrane protein, putative [Medicago truncatula]|uniref:Transmembrane protein, putative n=1 Tax=Medicago truncatula TaxID=3880 RepID=A0A072TRX0_MEDTR|nr:transmembrane protein, putative [Medicago truncatula]
METVTTTLQSLASQMQNLSQQMLQQSVVLTKLSKKLGSKGVTQEGETSSSVSVPSEIVETEKRTKLNLSSATKGKEEVLWAEALVSRRLINFQPSPDIIHAESITEERQRKQENTVNKSSSPSQDARPPPLPEPPDAVPLSKEVSDPPSPEPPPDSGQPVTTIPRRAPPPRPPDLQDSVYGVVYAILKVKKTGNVQWRLGGPPLMSPEPPYAVCNSECGIVAEGEKVLEKAGVKREIGELCICLILMGHMHKSMPSILHSNILLHVSSSGQYITPLLSLVSPNEYSLPAMCHANSIQCELREIHNQKSQVQTNNIGLLQNEFRWMVIGSNVSAAQIWRTIKTKATYTANAAESLARYPGLDSLNKSNKLIPRVKSLINESSKFLSPSLVIRLATLTINLVMKHKWKDGNPLMSGIRQQVILLEVFKYFRIMFDTVMILSLEVLPNFYHHVMIHWCCQLGKRCMYTWDFFDDESAFRETTLIKKDRKYEHVSRTRACIQIGSKLHDLVWNALLCGYEIKLHSVPSFNMIFWCSSFFMSQQDSREFSFSMVVAVNEICWIMFFTLNGLLNFVFDRGKFWCKGKMLQQGMHISALKLLNILVITCSSIPHYLSDYLLFMHGLDFSWTPLSSTV